MSDYVMWVGQKFYPWPEDFLTELRKRGLSKRVAQTNIPPVEPGDRLALIHPRACVIGDTLALAKELVEMDCPLPLDKLASENGQSYLALVNMLAAFSGEERKTLVKKHGCAFQPGVFCFVYLTGVQYIAKEGETELPEDLRGRGIEIVRVEYVKSDDEKAGGGDE